MKAVKRFLPKPVKRILRKSYEYVRARAEYQLVKRRYKKEFKPFIATINPKDEMFLHGQRTWHSDPYEAATAYLKSGEAMLSELEAVLAEVRRPFHQIHSFLEFACGYGRFTRFLIHRVDPKKLTVSDIDSSAVDFVRRTFGVAGFNSTAEAASLDHDGKYDVVFVASLFSHLSFSEWGAWLERLSRMLNEDGLLIFSTHGMHCYNSLSKDNKNKLELKAEGFYFRRVNETLGRLDGDYYGTTYVTESYVRNFVSVHSLGTLIKFYPVALWQVQDLYVLKNREAPDRSSLIEQTASIFENGR